MSGIWRLVNGTVVYLRDTPYGSDGWIIHKDGIRGGPYACDRDGNCINELDGWGLKERKRGNETGWPEEKR